MAPRPMMVGDTPEPVTQHVFLRGNPQRLGVRVSRAIPVSRNPLMVRVLVNRVWGLALWFRAR
ncbi:MAG: hypothetical protein M2R45_01619 [Verrucomicrobia subdivision 3 bacterium]|nr:hypothetical protein [Limisphaerales bacterium]MCS1412770.1 hypothetical protein [Limisphaerales bacterium]